MKVRTLPSIDHGTEVQLNNIDLTSHIIIQEKVDGSQLTIIKQDGVLSFYNKNKQVSPKRGPWLNVWLSLTGKEQMFEEGLSYHGEAFTNRQTNTVRYGRVPRYFWMLYEVVRPDNSILTPKEMNELVIGTGIETVATLFDSSINFSINLYELVNLMMNKIEHGEITSSLGGCPEGIVVKVINKKQGEEGSAQKISNTRYKFVRPEFAEMNSEKKKKLPQVSDDEFIKEVGRIFDVDARKQKAMQHLKEQNRWLDDPIKNMQNMVDEMDNDLLKERAEEIKEMLLVRFWKEISTAARGDVMEFLKSTSL